ncbi:PVC-type heme-binding CxxCH protein [Rubinisphaera margarita]|uniref:PVC-type heme-binding CxxCH protein n=1 Tax=Rubinisphaera margarita TaxID=2909586 RepID=UPI001EE79231|nr:PVC-type heme-binding CxxCH protein [Rubinisphaera margarita]MCG6156245.1 ThuA domain-containing protein [Rubinisphaera margarita]
MNRLIRLVVLPALLLSLADFREAEAESLKILFLGDSGHHQPRARYNDVADVFKERGIVLEYGDDPNMLQAEILDQYDGLLLYANIDSIGKDQANALLDYVASGHGFIPLHCATYCFRNDDRIVNLIGAQFKHHGAGTIRTSLADSKHSILAGFTPFASWDESYVHHRHHEEGRTVLEYRTGEPQAEGNEREPWTWVRKHGEGRVFYTAWGHDQRTWTHPGFQNLVERGIRWSCGGDPAVAGSYRSAEEREPFTLPKMTEISEEAPEFDYVDVGPKIPDYRAGSGETQRLMQKPLPTDKSQQHLSTPVGLKPELFVDETDLGGKPIAMNWDERGRLWVCETVDYPHDLAPNNQGRDHIRICEDSDGDGRADKFTLFADGLNIPTAITFHRGGAVVQSGRETLFLKDTSGDDKADQKLVLISGWEMGDTHGGVSNFRYGLDNWIWAMQGYNNSAPVINGEKQQSFRMGFFRFKLSQTDPPRVEQLEFVRSTNNNTWGLGITEEGLIFGSTANRNPSVFMPIANRYYERVLGWAPRTLEMISDTHMFRPITDKVRQVDHHGGYTAGAGHAIYTARAYPQQWWNRTAFVCGPTGHLVGAFVLEPNGAGFTSHNPGNLLASDDEWTAPILAEVGPDGNVWVLDWYNYIVQHNPTPHGFETGPGNAYLTDLRDKKFGRIYRVAADETKPTVLSSRSTIADLVAGLTDPTMLVRLQAQRLLIERNATDATPELIRLLEDESTDAIGLNAAAIHALHVLSGLELINTDDSKVLAAVQKALSHPSAGVRLNALRVLPVSSEGSAAILASSCLRDPEPQVRLAALLALSDNPTAQAGPVLARLCADTSILQDRWLKDALTSAAAMHSDNFLDAALETWKDSEAAAQVLATVAEHFARSRPEQSQVAPLLAALSKSNPQLAATSIQGLVSGWPKDYTLELTPDESRKLSALFDHVDSQHQFAVIQLARRWGSNVLDARVADLVKNSLKALENDRLPVPARLQAADRVLAFDASNDQSLQRMLDVISPFEPQELSEGLIQKLGTVENSGLGDLMLAKLETVTPSQRSAILRAMLARAPTTNRLLAAIEEGILQATDLSVLQRQALSEHPNRRIRERAEAVFMSAGQSIQSDRMELVKTKLPLTEKQGDHELGREIYRKNCAICHSFQGEGKNVGPDLSGLVIHPKAELLTHILDPNRSVESNFRMYTVVTADGLVLNGLLAAESQTSLEIVDVEGKRHSILREDIEQLRASTKSLMPEGLEKSIDDDGFVDLLTYLTTPGKYVPLTLDKVATTLSTQGMFYNRDNAAETIDFGDWSPKEFNQIPFQLVDPREGSRNNVVMLHGPVGPFAPQLPKSVSLPCQTTAEAIHLLGGIGGWASRSPGEQGHSMTVRLHYKDGATEDHELINGLHIADYNGLFEVPKSRLAFKVGRGQVRYIEITPKRRAMIEKIELVKGSDHTAPLIFAVTVETQSSGH